MHLSVLARAYPLDNEFEFPVTRCLNIKNLNIIDIISYNVKNEYKGQWFKYYNNERPIYSDSEIRKIENNKDKSMKPAIMYWLATIERDYRISMFDQTADNYLKECIEKYSTSKIAKKCFTLYKELQIISNTGSRGTDLPKSVSEQLDNYEKLVNKK